MPVDPTAHASEDEIAATDVRRLSAGSVSLTDQDAPSQCSISVVGTEFAGDDDNPAGAIAMFRLDGGLILSLYPRTELAKDADVPFGPPKSGEFSIGHLVATRADVDALLAQAETAGATPTGPARDRPWGIYSGYFRDPDGHLWEIIWNPRFNSEVA